MLGLLLVAALSQDQPASRASSDSSRAPAVAADTQARKPPSAPFGFADWSWLNGTSRQKTPVLDSRYFTGEFRVDATYILDFNRPADHTLVGTSESGRTSEVQVQQLGIGGDFHTAHARGRLMTQFGMYSTMTPRNDASPGRGQWNLADAYRYVSEAYGERWANAIRRQGNRAPSPEHGISLEQARSRDDLSRYVCQVVAGDGERPIPVALEVARGDLKSSSHFGHRTPWQVLADFSATGESEDLTLWREWEKATRGIHAIRWSNGLRAEVGLTEALTDEEIVAVEIGGEVVYTFSRREWSFVVRRRGALARVLDLAEEGGGELIAAFLSEVGVNLSPVLSGGDTPSTNISAGLSSRRSITNTICIQK